MQRALVIGGTGPTGHYIVNGLFDRGYETSILHTGRHEVAEIGPEIEHIHTDPFDEDALAAAIEGRSWDVTIATYGRLRSVARVFAGHTDQFVSIGGGPAYRGYMNADVVWPHGLMVPTSESAPQARDEAEDGKGFRVARSEAVVFEHHPEATHFRYPYIYGRYQIAPREWPIVRRIIDKRPHFVLPDSGLTLNHHGGAQNMAHAVLLAVDNPRARGEIFNCGDDKILTLRQVVEICARALDHEWDLVSMPYEFAVSARPLIAQPWTTHRVFDTTKIRTELGYADVVDPVEGVAQAARWLARNRIDARGERVLQDPFDYAAEDRLIEQWRTCIARMPGDLFSRQPGYTASYSGPGGSTRTADW